MYLFPYSRNRKIVKRIVTFSFILAALFCSNYIANFDDINNQKGHSTLSAGLAPILEEVIRRKDIDEILSHMEYYTERYQKNDKSR